MQSSKGLEGEELEMEMWRMKKTMKRLTEARGNGTSMISLIIPPGDQIARVSKMLSDEHGTAQNIKSRVNRLSVLGAITSAQQRLKLWPKVPTNGLVIYVGTVMDPVTGKEKKETLDFEPYKPINTSLYLCDSRFHTEPLLELLEDQNKFGFLIIDGSGALYGVVQGSNREVLHKFTVELPKKHGRGGQSAARFGRLRMEKRHNFIRKVAEMATQVFITNDVPNVTGLILAGLAQFKADLNKSDLFDPRLQKIVLKLVDVSYGGENGFNQAIERSAEVLANVKFVHEKRLIAEYFGEINKDSGLFCFGVKDTFYALEQGAVEVLIVWEELDMERFVLKHAASETEVVKMFTSEQIADQSNFVHAESGEDYEVVEQEPLTEWLAQHYKDFGAKLEFITNRSEEGSQFCRGFGGIGGMLRYAVQFYHDEDFESWDDSDSDFI